MSQVRNLKVNARGRCGIWIGDDDLPYKYPRQHLDRVKFHTDLDYIKIVREVDLVLKLPEITGKTYGPEETFSRTLFAHGLNGFPFILGETIVNGEPVAFTGSVPIQIAMPYSTSTTGNFARWLALGADATNVYIHEYVVFYYSNSDFNSTYPAIDLPVKVYVTDELLDVDKIRPPVGLATRISMSGAKFADGLVDTNNRFIRQVKNPADKTLNMARGPTIQVASKKSGVNTSGSWRWRVNAATQSSGAVSEIAPPDGFNTPLDISVGSKTPGKGSEFRANSGRIFAKGPGGRTAFDTNDKLFHTLDKLSGTQAFATFAIGTGTDVNNTTSRLLGSCDPNCTDVIGSIKFTLASYPAGMAYDRWHAMFGGSSAVWIQDGHGLLDNGSANLSFNQLVWYSFRVTAGQVFLDRRIWVSQNSKGTYNILAHSIQYKLKTGLFT